MIILMTIPTKAMTTLTITPMMATITRISMGRY